MGTSSCGQRGLGFWVGQRGGVRVKGGHSTGKVIAGAPLQGHLFPLQRLRGDVHTPLAPLLFFHPPPLTPLRPPLALLFLGSQGSRQPRVNKVIPGVGQREAFFSPPPFFSLNSHQQQTVGPPFHTTESCWDVEPESESVGRGGRACQSKNKPQVAFRTCPLCVCVHV